MTMFLVCLHAAIHLLAWCGLWSWQRPRWRLPLALLLPPLVPLGWWERKNDAEAPAERRRASIVLWAWLASLALYVLWLSLL